MRLRWWRIAIAAILAEVALIIVAIPLNLSPGGRTVLLYIVLPVCLIATYLGGWWAARRASDHFVLHGLLVGLLAALIYEALTLKLSLPLVYVIANALKLVGGAAGGFAAGRAAHATQRAP